MVFGKLSRYYQRATLMPIVKLGLHSSYAATVYQASYLYGHYTTQATAIIQRKQRLLYQASYGYSKQATAIPSKHGYTKQAWLYQASYGYTKQATTIPSKLRQYQASTAIPSKLRLYQASNGYGTPSWKHYTVEA